MHLGCDDLNDEKLDRVTLPYNIITDDYLFEHGKESWIVLSLMLRHLTIRGEVIFTLRYLFENIGIPLNRKQNKISIIQTINNIFNTDYNIKTDINQVHRIKYSSPKDNYLVLYDKEVDCILSCNRRIDRVNLFNTYTIIKRFVNYKTGLSYPSIDTISHMTNIASNNSIRNYIEVLEEMNLISCTRGTSYIIGKNGLKRPNNTYKILNHN